MKSTQKRFIFFNKYGKISKVRKFAYQDYKKNKKLTIDAGE